MSEKNEFPATWRIASDYDPNQHLMSLKGKAYLDVQNRMIWFLRDQRDLIARGLATCSHVVRTELVEQDRQAGFAQFKTYVRDVLGNEATMYGSETMRDFGDYAEKASTKSLGRALAMLGYGTQFAAEMDEGERVVDSPANASVAHAQPNLGEQREKTTPSTSAASTPSQRATDGEGATKATSDQRERMRKYREALAISDDSIARADNLLDQTAAEGRISEYIRMWQRRGVAQATAKTGASA